MRLPGLGDGGSALNATFSHPGVPVSDRFGNIFVPGFVDGNIRFINASSGVISTVAGDGSGSLHGDGENPLSAGMLPNGLSFSTTGNLFFSEAYFGRIRELVFEASTPSCPAGFFCACGLRPQACSDPSTFCPRRGMLAPNSVSPGFFATGEPTFDGLATAFSAQQACPAGSFCYGGKVEPCPSGTFGSARFQSSIDSCRACASGSYLAETGTYAAGSATAVRESPCLPCPPGSFAAGRGASFCERCPVNTHSAAVGASNVSACMPCAPGANSISGSSVCLVLKPSDNFAAQSGGLVLLQRFAPYDTGNLPDAALQALYLSTSTALMAVFGLLPLFCVLLGSLGPTDLRNRLCPLRCSWALLAHADTSTDKDTVKRGLLVRERSPLGGGCTVSAFGVFLCLATALVVKFKMSNTIVQQSSMPLTLFEEAKYGLMPNWRQDEANNFADLSPLLRLEGGNAPLSAGLLITVLTVGKRCSTHSMSFDTVQGMFLNSSASDVATGHALHQFACPDCMVGTLSYLSVSFDASCATFLVVASAVSSHGSVSVASFEASGVSSASAIIDMSVEAQLDFEHGTLDADGYPSGGRSYRGLFIQSVSSVASVAYSPATAAAARPTVVRLALTALPQYTLVQFFPNLTVLDLLSSLIGVLGTMSGGALGLAAWQCFVRPALGSSKARMLSVGERHSTAALAIREPDVPSALVPAMALGRAASFRASAAALASADSALPAAAMLRDLIARQRALKEHRELEASR